MGAIYETIIMGLLKPYTNIILKKNGMPESKK